MQFLLEAWLLSLVDGLDHEIEVSGEGRYLMGVRPTDLGLQPAGQGPCAVIDVVESHGATALLHLVWGPHRLMAQVAEPTEFEPGDEVGLVFRKVHRFDEQTGERI